VEGDEAALFTVEWSFTTLTNSNNEEAVVRGCVPRLLQLPYGTSQGCTLDMPQDASSSGALTCGIAAPQCIVGDFQAWLLAALVSQHGALQTAIALCIADARASLAPVPLVSMTTWTPPAQGGRMALLLANSSDAPAMVAPRRHWGQSAGETLATLEFVAGGLEALALALVCLVAICTVAGRRRVHHHY
jgi:hypothetical protein